MILSDGGPDFSPNSVLNSIFFFRLFKRFDLDLLSIFTYAARYSAFNPIEHLWSILSNKLSGVVFNSKVDGESKPPSQQSGLSNEQIQEKEKIVFDKVLIELQRAHWESSSFDGFDINISPVFCGEDDLIWNDYDEIKKFLRCPLNSLHQHTNLIIEFSNMFNHIDRHANEIVYIC